MFFCFEAQNEIILYSIHEFNHEFNLWLEFWRGCINYQN